MVPQGFGRQRYAGHKPKCFDKVAEFVFPVQFPLL